MLGLNNVQIIGNLGGTPEMKYLNSRDHVVNFSVAVNERWKNRNGESQERTTWLRIVAFNGIGSACAEHLKKGMAFMLKAACKSVNTRRTETPGLRSKSWLRRFASLAAGITATRSGRYPVNRELAPHHARRPRLKLIKVGRTFPFDWAGSGRHRSLPSGDTKG